MQDKYSPAHPAPAFAPNIRAATSQARPRARRELSRTNARQSIPFERHVTGATDLLDCTVVCRRPRQHNLNSIDVFESEPKLTLPAIVAQSIYSDPSIYFRRRQKGPLPDSSWNLYPKILH